MSTTARQRGPEASQASGTQLRASRGQRIILLCTLCYIGVLVLSSVAAPLLAPHDPTEQRLDQRFLAPGSPEHLLGTDDFGRDVLSRIIYGSRSALLVGLISVSIALSMGVLIGLSAGLGGRVADNLLMLLMDSVLSFPTILLAITVVTVFGYGLVQVMLAIGVIFTPVFARIVRAETLAIREESYVQASTALGSPLLKTVGLHILPNMLPRLIVQSSITFALAIVIEASLSFLGLGTQPPEASWGLMLKNARNYLFNAPWLALYPGLAIGLTVLSFNLLGDALSASLRGRR
jgi:ABC-type dipeptide/oligopeptide/nickel transport system permease subunit